MTSFRLIGFGLLVASISVPVNAPEAATYSLHPTSVINGAQNSPYFSYTPETFPLVTLSIQDSAVKSGSFSVSYDYTLGTYTGDSASLISFTIGSFITLTPSFGQVSHFRANILFNADGSVDVGRILYSSDRFEVDLAGTGGVLNGTFVPSDNLDTGVVSGRFTAVPEPTSAALLSAALIVTLRRRSTRASSI